MDAAAEIFSGADSAHREQLRARYRDLAVRQRILFGEYRAAGFSEQQALELTIAHAEYED